MPCLRILTDGHESIVQLQLSRSDGEQCSNVDFVALCMIVHDFFIDCRETETFCLFCASLRNDFWPQSES